MSPTPFAALADLVEQLEHTSKRLELTTLVARFLRGLAPDEIAPAVRMTIGHVFAEWAELTLNVSWTSVMNVVRGLSGLTSEQEERLGGQAVDGGGYVRLLLEHSRRQAPTGPPLILLEVCRSFEAIAGSAGSGSRARKEAQLKDLYGRATAREAALLTKIIFQEMRHGVNEGIMLDAIAQAGGVRPALVRRANQFWGDLGDVAAAALAPGDTSLRQAAIHPFHPVKPMLAQTAEGIEEAFTRHAGRLALEYKLDGARVQIHLQGNEVRVYSRNLGDVTSSLPDLVAQVRQQTTAREAVLDGEVIAVDQQGRPLPFQHLMRRFRRKHDVGGTVAQIPVELYLFDVLYLDGTMLVDLPSWGRWGTLETISGGLHLVRRLLPATVEEGRAFAEAAYRDGHEGLMAKDLDAAYTPGARGRSWLKLKHVLSLDLVIVAADWGYGRRHGWLSNYHLAARDVGSGDYLLVGKTFKGLTDDEFQAMTRRLLELERARTRATVMVQPQVVVEVLFNEIQASRQYPSGLALRFARILRIREDKAPAEADTLQTLRALFERQFEHKGRLEV
jgi:DNA ligase-1